jgi:hypothetical protein
MSWNEYARRCGVNRKTIGVWRQLGLCVLGPDGHIDVRASDRLLAERPRKYRGGICRGPATEVIEADVFQMPALGPPPELPAFRPRPRRR